MSANKESLFLSRSEAREQGLIGWNIRCNRCGSYGATWVPAERPGWGDLALCTTHREELALERERHSTALRELRAVNFEQERQRDPATCPHEHRRFVRTRDLGEDGEEDVYECEDCLTKLNEYAPR